jgi:hypothetical protein
MATLTALLIAKAGLVPAYAAANDGDVVAQPTDQRLFLHVKNGGGGSVNVTIPAVQATVNIPSAGAVAVPDIVVAVANGAEKMIGPFPPAYVNAAGMITINYSGVTDVTAAAFRLPRVG